VLRFAPIDLAANGSEAVAFRVDSFEVSFGSAEAFLSEWGRRGERYLDHLRARMSELPGSCVHVWLGSELVGQVELRGGREDPSEGYVNLYYLIPEKRGTGLGAALDHHAISWFTSQGLSRAALGVSPSNERAIRFYLKHGGPTKGFTHAIPPSASCARCGAARLPPNKRLQLTAAVRGVRRPWPAAVGSGARPPPAAGRC
jgi:GNAT superfamily N-acetyltransferase